VGDVVRKRLGLPGVNIELIIELKGAVDLDGLRRALAALHRVYPATASRLACSSITGRPRWRLNSDPLDFQHALQVRSLDPPTAAELHRQSERLLISPLNAASQPPLQFRLLRGLSAGDVLLMRWPHALMDVRGGTIVLEELERLYQEAPDPQSLRSAGDELRDDAKRLISTLPPLERARCLLGKAQAAQPPGWQDARLGQGPIVLDGRGLHYTLRRLSPEQTQALRDNSMRICGFARLGDYIRACAIEALHHVVPRPLPPGTGYSTMQLIDNRRRRQRAPVCHNFFSALPIYVPAKIAPDRQATADLISKSTAEMLSSGIIARRFAALKDMSRLPPSALATLMQRSLTVERRSVFGRGLGQAPSLPMGFMGSFSRPMPTFCGAELRGVYGLGVILPHEGFAVNLNTPNDQLYITGTYFEPRVTSEVMNSFLDRFIAALLDPS
jgi:hypothetical protein